MLQQLGVTDASFLYMETPETPMHVGSLYVYELPAGHTGDFYEDFKAYIASRLHLSPVFTRKLAQLPFDIDAPLWIEDDAIDLEYHIRRATLPKPGRFDQLEELVAELHSGLLDRSRPLWQIYIIDGLADGHVAEYTKFHHAGFDGSAAMALIRVLYDTTPVPRPVPPRPAPHQKEALDLINLIGLLYASPLRQYLRAMQIIPDFLKVWTKLTLLDPETLRLEPPALPPLSPWTPLNVAITNQRSYAARTVSLKNIKRIAKTNGTTVNDVVLAMCGGALRRYLGGNDSLPPAPLTAFVPMSLREAGNMQMSNQTIGMICSLATDTDDPVDRLRAIHQSSEKAKHLTDTIKSVALDMYSPWGVPMLVSGAMNLLGRYHLTDRMRPIANLTISNMIGSPVPLYIAGAKLLANYPMSIPIHGAALNITVMSYGENLDVGLVACRRTVPDVHKIADYMVEALDELSSALFKPAKPVGATHRAKKKRATGKTARRERTHASAKPAKVKTPAAAKGVQNQQDKPKYPYIAANNGTVTDAARQLAAGKSDGADARAASGESSTTTPSSTGSKATEPVER